MYFDRRQRPTSTTTRIKTDVSLISVDFLFTVRDLLPQQQGLTTKKTKTRRNKRKNYTSCCLKSQLQVFVYFVNFRIFREIAQASLVLPSLTRVVPQQQGLTTKKTKMRRNKRKYLWLILIEIATANFRIFRYFSHISCMKTTCCHLIVVLRCFPPWL